MAIKVKEMKDDALIDVKVNKTYYLMVKALSFYLFNQIIYMLILVIHI